MKNNNFYDVTQCGFGDPWEDIGTVINRIIDDIKSHQDSRDLNSGGKPGAVIYIPPGDYSLRTPVLIDISYLRIVGSGHGFTSSSIRFNTSDAELKNWHEIWPGGSRVKVELGDSYRGRAAFLVEREGSPRISSVEFSNFCIDGLHFQQTDTDEHAENTYINSKIGIEFSTANDSVRVTQMGFIYLEHALIINNADALSIHENFIAECGNCIELRGWGQASSITNNLIGAGFRGHSIFAENHGGLLITANNIFPRGMDSVRLRNVTRSNVSSNRLHSFYPGMLILEGTCNENLISSNHFLRDTEPWAPFVEINNGKDDGFGVIRLEGSNNTFVSNHISVLLDQKSSSTAPVIVHLTNAHGNYVASNHMVSRQTDASASDSCYAAQVDSLQSTDGSTIQHVVAVKIDPSSEQNVILDTCKPNEAEADLSKNTFRYL